MSQGIFVACTPAAVFVRVVGRGACRNSEYLREYGFNKLRAGYRQLYVDLRHCDSLDSTFLGVFAGFGLALGTSGSVTLVSLRGQTQKAFTDLGLDQIPSINTVAADFAAPELPHSDAFELLPGSDLNAKERAFDPLERALLMLETHEYLCQADARNEEKFREVKQCLREDIARRASRRPQAE